MKSIKAILYGLIVWVLFILVANLLLFSILGFSFYQWRLNLFIFGIGFLFSAFIIRISINTKQGFILVISFQLSIALLIFLSLAMHPITKIYFSSDYLLAYFFINLLWCPFSLMGWYLGRELIKKKAIEAIKKEPFKTKITLVGNFLKAFKTGLLIWFLAIVLFGFFSNLLDSFIKIPISMLLIFATGAFLIGLIIGIKFYLIKPILLAISVQAVISVLFGAFLFVLTKKEEFETIFQCSPFELLYNYIFHVLLWIGFSALGSFIGKSIKSRNRKLRIKNWL